MMKKLCVLLLFALTTGVVSAATISFSDEVIPNPSATDWTDQLFLPQFNSALGTLTEVRLVLNGSMYASFGYENKRDIAQNMSYLYNMDQDLSLTSTDLPSLTMATTRGDMSWHSLGLVPAFDGVVDYGGTSGGTIVYDLLTDSGEYIYTAAGDLAKFIGLGDVVYDGVATAYVTMGLTGGNSASKSVSLVGASVSVEYTYTPVPEPATVGLLSLGGLLVVRRRR